MAEKTVDLSKSVFSRNQYPQAINTDFTEFGVVTVQEELDSQVTVEDFFDQYNDLFYDIPAEGDTNSHAYLVRTSGEYISFDENLEEIDALRDEIATLRGENLTLQQENLNLQLSSSIL